MGHQSRPRGALALTLPHETIETITVLVRTPGKAANG
jgi:hypothetical protein